MKSRTYCPTPVARTSDKPGEPPRLRENAFRNHLVRIGCPPAVYLPDGRVELLEHVRKAETVR